MSNIETFTSQADDCLTIDDSFTTEKDEAVKQTWRDNQSIVD